MMSKRVMPKIAMPEIGKTSLKPAQRGGIICLIANALGAAIFLWAAHFYWIEPELADVPGASGGAPFVWAFTAMPFLVFFFFLNVAIAAWACLIRIRAGAWPLSILYWCWVPIWLAALALDNAHHGI